MHYSAVFKIYLVEIFDYFIKLELHNLQLRLCMQYIIVLLLDRKDLFVNRSEDNKAYFLKKRFENSNKSEDNKACFLKNNKN